MVGISLKKIVTILMKNPKVRLILGKCFTGKRKTNLFSGVTISVATIWTDMREAYTILFILKSLVKKMIFGAITIGRLLVPSPQNSFKPSLDLWEATL